MQTANWYRLTGTHQVGHDGNSGDFQRFDVVEHAYSARDAEYQVRLRFEPYYSRVDCIEPTDAPAVNSSEVA